MPMSQAWQKAILLTGRYIVSEAACINLNVEAYGLKSEAHHELRVSAQFWFVYGGCDLAIALRCKEFTVHIIACEHMVAHADFTYAMNTNPYLFAGQVGAVQDDA